MDQREVLDCLRRQPHVRVDLLFILFHRLQDKTPDK